MKSFLYFCCLSLLPLSGATIALTKDAADCDWISFSGGMSGIFDTEHNPTFVVEYRFGQSWHRVHPWAGLSWATDGAVFAGGGVLYTLSTLDEVWSLTAGGGPGYYERHQGADLGSHLEFCTFGEISRNLPWKHRVMIRLMHISNGGITERNPGNELLLLGYAMPLP